MGSRASLTCIEVAVSQDVLRVIFSPSSVIGVFEIEGRSLMEESPRTVERMCERRPREEERM